MTNDTVHNSNGRTNGGTNGFDTYVANETVFAPDTQSGSAAKNSVNIEEYAHNGRIEDTDINVANRHDIIEDGGDTSAIRQLPANLDTTAARLPQSYEEARTALANCEQLDECKSWADKASALASYARMASDDALEKMAMRIKARAIRRAGELLSAFDGRGGQNLPNTKRDGTVLFSGTRKDAARKAGLSERQQKTATRIARIPRRDFETRIESRNPPTITRLAARGTTRRPVVRQGAQDSYIPELHAMDPDEFVKGEPTPEHRREVTKHCLYMLDYFNEYGVNYMPGGAVPHLIEEDRAEEMREVIYRISGWSKAWLCSLDSVIKRRARAEAHAD